MTISLLLHVDEVKLAAIYSWLEQHKGLQVQLWGLENKRRAALLAYSDGSDDDFGWSNWAAKASQYPSELLAIFEQLELVVDPTVATTLNAMFLGAFTAVENTQFG